MNWKSAAISEVAKERIWKEHVETERCHRVVFDTFRVNPHRMATQGRPVTEGVNQRPKRFLDRERALLEAMEKRGLIDLGSATQQHLRQPQSQEEGAHEAGHQSSSQRAVVALPFVPGGGGADDVSPSKSDGSGSGIRFEPTQPSPRSPPRLTTVASPGRPLPNIAMASAAGAPALSGSPPAGAHSPSPPSSPPRSMPSISALSPNRLQLSNDDFHRLFESVTLSPTQKYREPQTSTQTVGWFISPLSAPDRRFQFPHKSCDITRFAQELMMHNRRSGGATKGGATPTKAAGH